VSSVRLAGLELIARAARIAEHVAGPHAEEVDRDARFPTEAIDALREEGLLSALIPAEFGGVGATVSEVAQITRLLGAQCSSTGLIFAMHHIQLACVVRHGRTELLRDFLVELAESQYLLASATTEVGIGGDLRTSLCSVQRTGGGRFFLRKQAPVISYGAYADAIIATARRSPESAHADQVLVLCRPPGLTLEQVSEWDALGFRGTCSPGFTLSAEGDAAQVFTDPFAKIAATTMLPTAHVLWSSVWLGIATAAVERARLFMHAEARKKPGFTPSSAIRLAELSATHQQLAALIESAARRYDSDSSEAALPPDAESAIAMNNIKVSASTMVVDIVGEALAICGLTAYRLGTRHSMSRLLRDAYGALVMVNNDRIIANNAQMLLMSNEY